MSGSRSGSWSDWSFSYSDPKGNEYGRCEAVPRAGVLTLINLPGVAVVIDELFRPED